MMQSRPPIVVILGHVDHGKTTLLDALRKSDVAGREHGGITQHTRAFQTNNITFVDTPGHAAFSQMRGRGGKIADIALLIVASTDGVMPQTEECIKIIKTSGLPMIVVLTKVDLPDSNVEKVKHQLLEKEVLLEGLGGDVPCVSVSAKSGAGLPELIEMINLVASLNPPQSDPEGQLEAVILESHLDAKRGPVATLIIKNGTLKVGQDVATDNLTGKVRAINTTDGESLKEANLSRPVEVLGLAVMPQPSIPGAAGLLKIILKADVTGSLEAITYALPDQVQVLDSGTGEISESDVLLAQSTGARIFGFNVKASNSASKLAEIEKIKIKTYKIIYELLDDIHKNLEIVKNPHLGEIILGKAEIKAEFKINADQVAGCKCIEGRIDKSDHLRIGAKEVRLKSLHVGKAEALTVKTGTEFGAIFSPYVDFKIGETIIAYSNATS